MFYNYIAEKGWDIYNFYIEIESGTTAKREQLQKLIQDAQDKKFDIILAKELSRLARNGELSYSIKSKIYVRTMGFISLHWIMQSIP
ncbi:recombinase family protein [Ureibacillus terrenus]|uniref:recombinase family protein n=1 Tax=Ureibacillus terrenus TaxID=118246 RepID=UPI001FEB039B|nr:recombinase family protein [Ureibacillus terrenus]